MGTRCHLRAETIHSAKNTLKGVGRTNACKLCFFNAAGYTTTPGLNLLQEASSILRLKRRYRPVSEQGKGPLVCLQAPFGIRVPEILDHALSIGRPGIFNTEKGTRFTARAFSEVVT